jgi:hypothetical protein
MKLAKKFIGETNLCPSREVARYFMVMTLAARARTERSHLDFFPRSGGLQTAV